MSGPQNPSALRALLRALWQWPLALLILFEEWGWDTLQRLLAWLGAWPGFRQLEAWVRRLPPYGALALFGLPAVALLPVKLLALWAIGRGHALLGLGVIVAAKLGGTALVAHLFTLTRPALMQLAWFARWHDRWVPWKAALLQKVRASAPWRLARALVAQVKARWHGRKKGPPKGP